MMSHYIGFVPKRPGLRMFKGPCWDKLFAYRRKGGMWDRSGAKGSGCADTSTLCLRD